MNKDRKIKLLLITPYFYPESGGLESYAYNISKGLVEKGFDVTILCSTRDKTDKTEFIDGIKVIRQKPNFIFSNTPIRFNLFFKMSKLVKENDFDLINAHTPVPFYADVAAMVSKIHKIPFVLTYHGGSLMKDRIFIDAIAKIYQLTIEKFTLAQADRIITVSEFVKNNYLKEYKEKVCIISPGVDIGRFKPSNNMDKTQSNILFVAQLTKGHKLKGLDYLLESIKLIKKDIWNIKLTVVGSGNYIDHYKDKVNELHIKDNVKFKGGVYDEELVKEYQKTTILVLPTYTNAESFGMVLIEGNACGKPVIGTRVGGIQHVIEDGKTGLLAPPKDSEALADVITKLLNDEDMAKKMGENGRRLVEERYTWKRAVEMTEKVYNEVIS